MSNSSLVSFTRKSPNHSGKRTHSIDTITIHCMAGNLTVESCGALFAKESREASSNYGIGSDGRVGLYVDEENRSWCTSSRANDQRAVTIEVANNGYGEPWPVSDKAYKTLVELVTDICKRNGIQRLVWSTSKNDRVNHLNGCNLTVHRDYAAKSCPGNYLYGQQGQIAEEVNKRLKNTTPAEPEVEGKTAIVGAAKATAQQMAQLCIKRNTAPKLPNCTVEELAEIFLEEGKAEGIRGDVAWAQSLHETGFFKFGGIVLPDQNNYGGIGALNGNAQGQAATFPDPRTGVRAQIQHLKAYASTEPLVNECVDPRFSLVARGAAPFVEWLGASDNPQGKGWAYPGAGYGAKITALLAEILKVEVSQTPASGKHKVGEIVQYGGGLTFASANAESPITPAPGRVKVTAYEEGAKHPYRVIHIDDSSTVDAWVDEETLAQIVKPTPAKYAVNDIVQFKGGPHFRSADAEQPASTPAPGPAKVTGYAEGEDHPYHVIHTDDSSSVYGWVDEEALAPLQETAPAYIIYEVKEDETLWGIAVEKLGSGIRYTEIKELSGLKSNTIFVGQKLKIPTA